MCASWSTSAFRSRFGVLLVWCALVALANISAVFASPELCTSPSIVPLNLSTEHALFTFFGNKITANALDPDTKELIPSGKLDYLITSLLEVPMWFNGTHYSCQSGRAFSPTYVAPQTMFYGNLKILNLTDGAFCDLSYENVTIAPGKFANAVSVVVTWPTDPDLLVKLTFGLTTTTEPVVVKHFPPSYSTGYHDLSYTYSYVSAPLFAFYNTVAADICRH